MTKQVQLTIFLYELIRHYKVEVRIHHEILNPNFKKKIKMSLYQNISLLNKTWGLIKDKKKLFKNIIISNY